ncbi:MAG TPA: hypothetical protein PLX69_22160 [Leptospiraceae bacterium]|nr:hypothetical protein [Leptospiraceae bacterium]
MHNLRKLFFLFIILLFGCKKSEVQEANIDIPPDNIEYVNYVINPNGVALYKKAGDFKSKQVVVQRGESVEVFKERTNQGEIINVDGMEWTRVRYKGEELFYFGTSYVYRDDLNFRQMEIVFPDSSTERFAIVQKPDSYLYESPFADSKKLETLEVFSLLEILKASQPSEIDETTDSYFLDEPIWLEVKTNSNKIGFVNLGVARYRDKESAEFAIKKKQILERGFIQINRNSIVDSRLSSGYEKKILREQEFIPVYSSTMENKKRIYHFNFYLKTKKILHIPNEFHRLSEEDAKKGRLIWDTSRCVGTVSENQGTYFSNRYYSKYTFENTKYKGDHTPLEILYAKLSQENEGYDFRDFQLRPISIYKEGISYYKAKVYRKYQSPERREEKDAKYFVFKKIDGKYELVSDGIESLGVTEFVDLDKDGIDEMIILQRWRMVEYKSILALQNGVYQSIPQMGHEHGFTIEGHRIYLRGRKTDKNGNNGKDVKVEYKYSKGELIPLNENL